MTTRDLSTIGSQFVVALPRSVTALTWESTLKRHLQRSRNRATMRVCFDLSETVFFDVTLLGPFAAWLELLRGKRIELSLPGSKRIQTLLADYGLPSHCISLGVHADWKAVGTSPFVDYKQGDYLPLRTGRDEDFLSHLDSLESFEPLLPQRAHVSLRDTVLRELRENITRHADDSFPYLLMTKYRTETAAKAIPFRAQWGAPWELPFYRTLQASPAAGLFEISLGDLGPGIPEALRRNPELATLQSHELLRRAFLLGTTSSPEKRLEELADALKAPLEDLLRYPPANGLYRVWTAARNHSALLTVRAESYLLVFDFLTANRAGGPTAGTIIQNFKSDNRTLQTLAHFPGTHYHLVFPLTPSMQAVKPAAPGRPVRLAENADKPRFVWLDAPWPVDATDEEAARGFVAWRTRLEKAVRAHQTDDGGNRQIVLSELFLIKPTTPVQKKLLHYLAYSLVSHSSERNVVVPALVSAELLEELRVAAAAFAKADAGADLPILLSDGSVTLVVGEAELRSPSTWPTALNRRTSDDDLRPRVPSETSRLPCDGESLLRIAAAKLAELQRADITDPGNGVFHPGAKVCVRNRYFVEGFFEAHRLLEGAAGRAAILSWLRVQCRLNDISVLIIFDGSDRTLASEDFPTARDPIWFPDVSEPPYGALLPIRDTDRVGVFCEVIGTGASLAEALSLLPKKATQFIFSIIDASPEPTSRSRFAVEALTMPRTAILRHPLKYYDERPTHWTFDAIREVDTKSHTLLLRSVRPPTAALWATSESAELLVPSTFGESALPPALRQFQRVPGLTLEGHFQCPGDGHLSFYFPFRRLIGAFGAEFVKVIASDLKTITRFHGGRPVALLYPDYNPGVRELASSVASAVGASRSVPLSRREGAESGLERDVSAAGLAGAIVLILDDSISSGRTTRQLIRLAYQAGAEAVCAYPILDRADPSTSAFFRGLASYTEDGETKRELRVRHLVDLPIPVFAQASCPLCAQERSLAKLLAQQQESRLPVRGLSECIASDLAQTPVVAISSDTTDDSVAARVHSVTGGGNARLEWRCLLERACYSLPARQQAYERAQDELASGTHDVALLQVLSRELLYFFDQQRSAFERVFFREFSETIECTATATLAGHAFEAESVAWAIRVWWALNHRTLLEAAPGLLAQLDKASPPLSGAVLLNILIADWLLPKNDLEGIVQAFRRARLITTLRSECLADLDNCIEHLIERSVHGVTPALFQSYTLARLGPYYHDNTLAKIRETLGPRRKATVGEKPFEGLGEARRLIEQSTRAAEERVPHLARLLESDLFNPSEKDALRDVEDALRANRAAITETVGLGDLGEDLLRRSEERLEAANNQVKGLLSVLNASLHGVLKTLQEDGALIAQLNDLGVAFPLSPSCEGHCLFFREEELVIAVREVLKNLSHAFPAGWNGLRACSMEASLAGPGSPWLIVRILDSGEPVARPAGKGIQLVRQLAHRYGGKFFPPHSLLVSHEGRLRGFTKAAELHLLALSPAQEVLREQP